MNKLYVIIFAAVFSATSQASLEPRLGGHAVYDTDLDITWLADANLAKSNVFGLVNPDLISGEWNPDGTMSWYAAYYFWIPALNAHRGVGYLGFNDWRMPTTLQPDFTCSNPSSADLGSIGFGCTGSEMGHLFYEELGGVAGTSIINSADPDLALFKNLQSSGNQLGTWSGICCSVFGDNDFAYYFLFDSKPDPYSGANPSGSQDAGPWINQGSWVTWVVRDGDVGTDAAAPTAPILISPDIDATGIDTTATFSWEVSTDANGDPLQYSVTVCELPDFSGCTPEVVASTDFPTVLAGLGGGTSLLLLAGLVMPNARNRRQQWVYGSCVVSIVTLMTACGGGGGGDSGNSINQAASISQAVAGLKSNTQYYWKVTARDYVFSIDSEVRSFTTQ